MEGRETSRITTQQSNPVRALGALYPKARDAALEAGIPIRVGEGPMLAQVQEELAEHGFTAVRSITMLSDVLHEDGDPGTLSITVEPPLILLRRR